MLRYGAPEEVCRGCAIGLINWWWRSSRLGYTSESHKGVPGAASAGAAPEEQTRVGELEVILMEGLSVVMACHPRGALGRRGSLSEFVALGE